MTIKKQPQIRFGGFGGDWEEKKIADIGELSAGGDVCKEKLSNSGKYPVLANALSNDGILGYYDDFQIVAPAVTITGRGDVGVAKARYVNFSAVVRLLALKPTQDFDVGFLENAFNRLNIHVESTGVPQLTRPQFGSQIFRSPQTPEQIAIGQFFRQLDEMLTLAEQKHAQTVQLKKAILGKLFPISGSLQPQIRLKGFSGDWVERKLGDCLLQEIKGKAQIEKLNTGNTPYLDASFLNGGKLFLSDGIQDVQKDDVLIIWDGSNAGKVYFGFSGALGSTLKAYKTNEKCYSAFLYQELLRNEHVIFNQYRTPNIPHVIKDFTEEYVFRLPENIAEQTAIGKLFQTLDHTIALQAKEITQIKQLKSALLGKMFV